MSNTPETEVLNYIVCYNNGHVVRQKRIHGDYLYQIEIGVIKHIICLEENEIFIRIEDGTSKKVKLQTLINP
jgi:hypothetical protein